MTDKVFLVLENGEVYEGLSFGSKKEVVGEVVFTTAMTGYCETLTDKSYFGQIIVQSFPLIGNYGNIVADHESGCVQASGYIVNDWCRNPSNFRNKGTVDAFLKSCDIPGIYGIDTRKLIRTIRTHGVMNGKISYEAIPDPAMKDYCVENAVQNVSIKHPEEKSTNGTYRVAVMDYGYKENICRELVKRNCAVTVFPYNTKKEEIEAFKPDGIMLTNGPGDPEKNQKMIEEIKKIMKLNIPIFGICLGHQLLALANGCKTKKLKFGHRGANHPAKNVLSGRTYITSQNHGYAVLRDSIDKTIAQEMFVNVNDDTNEGILYHQINAFSVQFHPEGCGGPRDTEFLFDDFITRMEEQKHAKM